MPIYSFKCDYCNKTEEIYKPIKEGPPKLVKCPECGVKMYQELECSFVLRGPGWAGKEVKHGANYHAEQKAVEEYEQEQDQRNIAEKEAAEVTRHRRMGKKASLKYRQENKKVWDRYCKNLKKGIGKKSG